MRLKGRMVPNRGTIHHDGPGKLVRFGLIAVVFRAEGGCARLVRTGSAGCNRWRSAAPDRRCVMRPALWVVRATSVLPVVEDFDDAHGATAAGAWFAQGEGGGLGLWPRSGELFMLLDAGQGADLRDVGLAGRAGQQAAMPDAVEPVHCPAGACKACCRKAAGYGSGSGE